MSHRSRRRHVGVTLNGAVSSVTIRKADERADENQFVGERIQQREDEDRRDHPRDAPRTNCIWRWVGIYSNGQRRIP